MESKTKEKKVQESNSFNSSKNSCCSNMTVARRKSNDTSNTSSEKRNDSTRCQLESASRELCENSKAQNSSGEMKEFWDFLTEINEIKSKLDNQGIQENEFTDFLKPDDCSVSESHLMKRSSSKSTSGNKIHSSTDLGLGESLQKSSCLSQSSIGFSQEKESSKPKTENSPSERDPFWDFLDNNKNETEPLNYDDEFLDFIYSKTNKKKAPDSEDDFWDFLKHDTPDELSDVVKSITDSVQPTPRSDTTDTPMSVSEFTRFQTGINTRIDSELQMLERSLSVGLDGFKEANIRNSKYKSIASLPPKFTLGSELANYQGVENSCNLDGLGNAVESSLISGSNCASTYKNSENTSAQGGNLPCISSVYSMQPYSSAGKVVTEVFPSSVGYTVSNSIVQSTGFPHKTIGKTSVFIQEKNKKLTKVGSEKKITNVFPIRKNFNKTQKVERVNNRSLPNNPITFLPPNIKTENESGCNTSSKSTNEVQKNSSRNIQEVMLTQISQASASQKSAPVFIQTSQTNTMPSSAIKNNTNPLYFLVPGNSESFKNPNYSHYFVVVNNNPPNQPADVINTQNQTLLAKTTSPSSTVPTINQNASVSQSTNVSVVRQIMVPKPQYVQSSNSEALKNSTSIKVINQNKVKNISLLDSSVVNLTGVLNSSTSTLHHQQSSQNILQSFCKDGITNVNYIPVTSILLKEPLFPLKNTPVANRALPLANNDSNTSKFSFYKPIKNIPLGENKNAILQLSIPEKMGSTPDEEALATLSNSEIIPPLNVPLKPDPHSASQRSMEQPLQNRDAVSNPTIRYAILTGQQMISNSQQSNPNSSSASKGLDGVTMVTNPSNTTQPNQTYSLSLNSNNQVTIQANASLPNVLNAVNNANLNSQNEKLAKPNQYVQVRLAPPPITNQGLLPTPVPMVPISIVQPTLSSQPRVSKVLVLKGQPLDNQSTTVQCNPVATIRRSYASKLSGKSKKNGPKTVRQLLEEYRKKQMSQGPRPQKPILKRILKMPINTAYALPSGIKAATGNCTYSNEISKKRPNILVLPSASKHIKKNVIKENPPPTNFVARRELDFTGSSTNYETECDSYLDGSMDPFSSDKRDFRPRHYDLSELQIGFFKVEDDIEYSCGRFRSKFKVLFSKGQFLYDFPVSRCNRMDLKSSHIWEKRVRVVVPFKTVTSMEMRDRIINIYLSGSPSIYLGRVQAKAGVINNTIVYDTLIEDGSQWGDDIKNTLMHKVVLRKRQANKLKTSLCEFDESFVLLTNIHELGTPAGIGGSMTEKNRSPNSFKQDGLKNKKLRIRRLSRWDSPEEGGEQSNSDEALLLENQMCSCRISCRSIRCSCVKAARSCSSSLCLCVSCDNPLNLLVALGMNIEFSLSDSCLFQNIYPIPKLADFLKREMKLACCNTYVRVQDCIPGTVLCPNVDCNVHLEFSWCRGMVCYPERNPRNHCSFCGQCCFSNKRHCFTCRRCYIISPQISFCPTCKKIPPLCTDMPNNSGSSLLPFPAVNQKTRNPPPKPEIILLDSRTVSKPPKEQKPSMKAQVENPRVSEIQDMLSIESPKRDNEVLLECAATL